MHQSSFRPVLLIFVLLFASCSTPVSKKYDEANTPLERFRIDPSQTGITTYCTADDFKKKRISKFSLGDIVCARHVLKHGSGYVLKIHYRTTNKKSNDPYEKGFWELQAYNKNRLVKIIKIRKKDDPAWHDVSFVRIRDKKYFADIDNDNIDDFAIFPYSPGSASFGTLRIFSLKNNISRHGNAKYHIEGDGHALFNCPKCSKINFDECKKCR